MIPELMPLVKAREEAKAVVEKSKMTIRERMLAPYRKAKQAIGGMLGIGKKEAEKETEAEKQAELA